MTTYNSDQIPFGLTTSGLPNRGALPIGAHGEFKAQNHLHATVTVPSTLALNDTINVGFIPPNAVVTGVGVKAATQLDSGGSPALTLDLGIVGTLQLFQAAIADVGRTVAATADKTVAGPGCFYKNTTGAKLLIVATVHAAAATAVAGTLEYVIDYFVEE